MFILIFTSKKKNIIHSIKRKKFGIRYLILSDLFIERIPKENVQRDFLMWTYKFQRLRRYWDYIVSQTDVKHPQHSFLSHGYPLRFYWNCRIHRLFLHTVSEVFLLKFLIFFYCRGMGNQNMKSNNIHLNKIIICNGPYKGLSVMNTTKWLKM